jgi:hypothetical protein
MARRARGGEAQMKRRPGCRGCLRLIQLSTRKDLGWSSASALIAAASGHRGLG